MKFLSEEWFEEFRAITMETFSPGKTPTGVTTSLCECYSDVPLAGGEKLWMMYVFENGILTSLERGLGESSIPSAEYTSDATYDIVVKLLKGEMANAKAVLSGKVKLKGNVTKALKLISTHDYIDKCKHLGGKTEW